MPCSNARAGALGLVSREALTIPDIAHLVQRVSADGHAREQEMRVRRPPLGRELLELRCARPRSAPGRSSSSSTTRGGTTRRRRAP
ncbi:MAG: hypothetical protein U0R65_06445 [Candidatus Nanopelagicales bacterium]